MQVIDNWVLQRIIINEMKLVIHIKFLITTINQLSKHNILYKK